MPKDEQTLWDWLTALDDASRAALLAHCVCFGVNALYEKADRYGGPASRTRLSTAALARPIASHTLSGSTWSKPAGGRRSTIISAA